MKYKSVIMFGIICLISVDLFLSNYGYYSTTAWKYFMEKNEFVDHIQNVETGRYIITPDTEKEFKIFPEDKMALKSHYAALYGLYTISGMEVMRIANYEAFSKILYETKSLEEAKRYIDVSGISYLITANDIEDKDFKHLESVNVGKKSVHLYKYLKSPGRFLLFKEAVYVNDAKTAAEKLTDNVIDLRSTLILIDKEKGINPPQSPPLDLSSRSGGKGGERGFESFHKVDAGGLVGTTNLISYNANKVVIECDAKTDAFLYVSDTCYPGWRAYVDGMATKIYQANLAFRAVKVPAGRHVVVFKYVPVSFYMGLALTVFGVLLCVYLVRRDRKGKDEKA